MKGCRYEFVVDGNELCVVVGGGVCIIDCRLSIVVGRNDACVHGGVLEWVLGRVRGGVRRRVLCGIL